MTTKNENNTKDMRFYIAGRAGKVGRMYFNILENKAQYNEYETVIAPGEKGATATNSLAVLNRTMEQMIGLKAKGNFFKEPVVIYTVGLVTQTIERGTFKYWLATGKRNDGTEINKTELEQWNTFAELYQELFLDVIIKNISKASINKNSKFAVTAQQKKDAEIVSSLWDKLPKAENVQFEESDSDVI